MTEPVTVEEVEELLRQIDEQLGDENPDLHLVTVLALVACAKGIMARMDIPEDMLEWITIRTREPFEGGEEH